MTEPGQRAEMMRTDSRSSLSVKLVVGALALLTLTEPAWAVLGVWRRAAVTTAVVTTSVATSEVAAANAAASREGRGSRVRAAGGRCVCGGGADRAEVAATETAGIAVAV
jgi:hypothetical protein